MNLKQTLSSKHSVIILSAILLITLICCASFFWISHVKELRRKLLFDEDDDFFASYEYLFIEDSKKIEIDDILAMKDQIEVINNYQEIHNELVYGPVKSTTFVIVIQVHDNIIYLKELVQSLKYVMGITQSLLIFCHNYYDQDINEFIGNITFAKWMQIFYPFSTQLHPKSFPGPDSFYCTDDFNCQETGILRRAEYTQQKHLWWWQMNFVFDHIRAISQYSNPIVFFEEGQYVLKDFLYMLRVLGSLMLEACPQCEMMSFGSRDPDISQYDLVDGNVVIEKWIGSFHNYALAFNRTVWRNIKLYSKYFCYFNDYKWDQSLRYLAEKRSGKDFTWFTCEAPRVLRFKKCDGIEIRCNMKKYIDDVIGFAWTVKRGLYPRNMIVSHIEDQANKTPLSEGGHWSDVRDRELCIYFTKLR